VNVNGFIAAKLKFGSALSVAAMAVSYFVIIVSIAISSGFRKEIRDGVSELTGDVRLCCYGDTIPATPEILEALETVRGVREIRPVISKAGIVKGREDIHGVMVKGIPTCDSLPLQARIPEKLSRFLNIRTGDKMLTYFVDDKVRVRSFTVSEIYSDPVQADEDLIVYVSLPDMQRLCGYGPTTAGALEITLDDIYRTDKGMKDKAGEIGMKAYNVFPDSSVPIAEAVPDLYPQLFDWLSLIDFNVLAILLLMTIVAGFNMISGLLILLFRSIPTIGTLKALGMDNRGISGVFLRVAERTTLIGMGIGNAAAILFCLIQGSTRLIKLNPDNYFVPYVPVNLNLPWMLAADVLSFAVIAALLLIPALFISKVDPAETVRVR